MIGNKIIVGLVIATMVLSCVAVAVTADEGRVEPMGIFPDSITATEIAGSAVGTSEILNTDSFVFANVAGTGTSKFTLSSSNNGADALEITASAGGIDIAATSGVAGEDLDIGISGTTGELRLASAGTAADAISIQASAGGVDADAAGQVNIASSQAVAGALTLTTSNAAGDIVISSASNTGTGINIDSVGGVDADAAGQVNIASSQAVAGALTLTTSNAAGDIVISSASNTATGINIDSVGGITVNADDDPISINGGTGAITLGGTGAIRTIAIGTDNAVQTVNIGTDDTPSNVIGIGGSASTTTFKGTVVMPSGSAVAHLLNSSDTVMTVSGTDYAGATEVLNTSTGSDHISTQGTKNFLITYSANTSVSAGQQLIITNISVIDSAGDYLHTSTPTNLTFADSYATFMQNTIQVFVEEVGAADDMDIVVRARKTGGTVSVQNQTLTVIAV